MKVIPILDLSREVSNMNVDLMHAIQNVLNHGKFINGPEVQQLEAELANLLNTKVRGCANGTDALQIAFMALGLKAGDEVIVPAFTYVATVEVLKLLQLNPVLVDVDADTFTINVEKLKAAIGPKTKAIIPVHLFGQNAAMREILSIARENNLYVVEDAAQSIGATYQLDEHGLLYSGTMGHIGCTSFFPTKNLACYGDGGAFFSNDEALFATASMIANHGQVEKYKHQSVGINSRLDTLQAAILLLKLKNFEESTKKRQSLAERYDIAFSNLSSIQIPFRNPRSSHVFHQYVIQIKDGSRDKLAESLRGLGIETMVYYPLPIHFQEAYKSDRYPIGSFPVSERLCSEVLALPIFPDLSIAEQDYVIEQICQFFR